MNHQALGAVSGLVAAIGLLLVASWVRARRPARIGPRIAPFVPTLPSSRRSFDQSGWSTWSTLRVLTGVGFPVGRRRTAARPADDAAASLRRLTWVVIGGVVGTLSGVLLGKGSPSPVGVVVLGVLGAAGGYLALDQRQVQGARRRRARIDQQLPTIVEVLAFAVAAGESPIAALDRIATTTSGELSQEIRTCVSDVRSGSSVDRALHAMSDRVRSVPLSRFVDTLIVAMDRGTPLAEVMRAQAADCRADERRTLLEIAGRKDVLMLVPVVFLILPTVVLVALFPGIQTLRLVVA